jgi:tetratricopeptide (TPR) repeat protein
MVHRVFRLSISPERAPEVRRVIDFDGRCTLHDVHDMIQRELDLDDDHLYAFYLSGRYFDRSSEHSLSQDSRHDSQRSVLFRLGLNAGQQLAYLFDFGDEHRHAVTVVTITDVEVPLAQPVLVESVGEAPSQYGDVEEDEEPYELPEHLTEVAPLAGAVLALSERLDGLYEEDEAKHARISEDDNELTEVAEDEELTEEDDDEATSRGAPAGPPEAILSLLRELSKAALELAEALEEDEEALHELDEWSQERELLPRLVDLPLGLVSVGELDRALAIARAFTFVALESFNADIAIIFAESGKRDEAMVQIESNLKQFPESCLTAIKSGAALEALGDAAAAETSYRRAMALAEDETEEEEAFGQLIGLLEDMGRFEEIDALLSPSTDVKALDAKPLVEARPLAPVGRNDPCPCGGGKKYKKCHGA